MLNLVRLRETAVYEDGTMVTGHEAYAAYGRESAPGLQSARRADRMVRASST